MPDMQDTATKRLKREILVRLIKAFYSDDFAENTRLIPYAMRPKGAEVPFRCCIYKEREILRSRTIAGLGFSIEEDDEQTLLSQYAERSLDRIENKTTPLTVLENACKGCPSSKVYVTELCQNCVAKPCISACKFGAIRQSGNRSKIDEEKCKKCGLCITACPYGAITKTIVPCEHACPVDAIAKTEQGFAKINFDKCISCGKCVSACPFGAVHARSQVIDVLKHIKDGKKVAAMLAPAIFGQLPCTPQQLHTAIKQIGFTHVYEVAQGAETTAKTEAHDLAERLHKGDAFMTTSCCAAYNELVAKHLPEIKPFVSDTKTPLYYTAEIVKQELPDVITVFFSPCFAKRKEAKDNKNVDYVLSFEELGAILIALNIDIDSCSEEAFAYDSAKEARDFAVTGGVARSVIAAWEGDADNIKPVLINGLNKSSIKDLKKYALTGKCELGNLIEVMSCEGGCIGGNAALNSLKDAFKKVSEYSSQSTPLKEK